MPLLSPAASGTPETTVVNGPRRVTPGPERRRTPRWRRRVVGVGLPVAVAVLATALWAAITESGFLPRAVLPNPLEVLAAFGEEIRSGRLFRDMSASLFRLGIGFTLAVALAVPLGVFLGQSSRARLAFVPGINFFRSMSPLAWIPFAILWFGIGDLPSIFLIFLCSFFPMTIATLAAISNVPSIYHRVANDFGFTRFERLTQVTLPAIMPQLITAIRVTAGIAWVVIVAAEMISGQDGLGFAIWDARNGLRHDLLVVEMITIGTVGLCLDYALVQLTKIPSVRWGYER